MSDRRGNWWKRLFGRVKREVGEATGDRKVEAKGATQALTGQKPDDDVVIHVEEAMRRKHGDIPPTRR